MNITPMVDVGYKERQDLEMQLLVGFGHTAFPVDYRTKAMVKRDREANEAFAREPGIDEGLIELRGTEGTAPAERSDT